MDRDSGAPATHGLFLRVIDHLDWLGCRMPDRPIWTSSSTGTEISGRDFIGKRPLHRPIDFAASELESYQKGCRKQQD